ncbi:hypothetical protein [Moorena producens]|nr:hypothetical protein [Moorena producens]
MCKVAKSPSAPCSEVPAPCSLFKELILVLSDYLSTVYSTLYPGRIW